MGPIKSRDPERDRYRHKQWNRTRQNREHKFGW